MLIPFRRGRNIERRQLLTPPHDVNNETPCGNFPVMNRVFIFGVAASLLLGCGAHLPVRPALSVPAPQRLDATMPESAEVRAVVERYKAQLGERLSARLAVAAGDFSTEGGPSNALGVLVADETLAWFVTNTGPESPAVQCFVTNNGGLRAPLYAGEVKLSHVYEVMPFDNELVVLTLSGAQLLRVAVEIARKGGEPVAGVRFEIHGSGDTAEAKNVFVASQPLDPAATYQVGTTDYLAESGWLSGLVKGAPMRRTGALMRDVIAERLKAVDAQGVQLQPKVDDRIQKVQP